MNSMTKYGSAVGRGAAVEQARDVRMLQAGHDLPLEAEVADHVVQVEAPPDDLDRDFFLKTLVGALGAVDGAHAAAADVFDDPVRARASADQRVARRLRRASQGLAILFVGLDQGLHLFAQFAVAFAGARQVVVALGGGPAAARRREFL